MGHNNKSLNSIGMLLTDLRFGSTLVNDSVPDASVLILICQSYNYMAFR